MFNTHATLCYVPAHFQHSCVTTQLLGRLAHVHKESQATMVKLQKLEIEEETLKLQLNAMGFAA